MSWTRALLPPVAVALSIGSGLRLTANLRTHPGLYRPSIRRREIATAQAIANLAPPSGVIYDIGANIGLYTLVFAAGGQRQVVSFEPSPLALPQLRRNVALSRLPNITLHSDLLSDRSGQVRFTLDEATTCTSHVSADGEAGALVACSDLDSVIAREGLPVPDVVKIDVEGHDGPVIRGMARLLATHRPLVCLEGGQRNQAGEVPSLQVLVSAGYELWNLSRTKGSLTPSSDEYVFLAVPR